MEMINYKSWKKRAYGFRLIKYVIFRLCVVLKKNISCVDLNDKINTSSFTRVRIIFIFLFITRQIL